MTVEQLIAKLEREQFNSGEGLDAIDVARRAGWNDRSRSLIAVLSQGDVEAGLREMRASAPGMSGGVEWDLSDLGGES